MSSMSMRLKQTLAKRIQKVPRERSDLENPALANTQSNSIFITKLPYDVRRMIYDEVLLRLGSLLHINVHPNNITTSNPTQGQYPRFGKMHRKCQACLCENSKERGEEVHEECCNGFWFRSHRDCYVESSFQARHKRHLHRLAIQAQEPHVVLELFLLCRIIYIELPRSLYPGRTFDFMGLHSAQHFFTITPTIHLDFIQSFQMEWIIFLPLYHTRAQVIRPNEPFLNPTSTENYWTSRRFDVDSQEELFAKTQQEEKTWERTCQCLFDMKNLSTLVISLHDVKSTMRGPIPVSEKELLRPLMKFIDRASPVEIDIQLPWHLDDAFEPNEGMLPFQVKRKPLFVVGQSWGMGGVTYGELSFWPSFIRRFKWFGP